MSDTYEICNCDERHCPGTKLVVKTPTDAEELARVIAITEGRHWSRTNEHDPTHIAEYVAELAERELARLRTENSRLRVVDEERRDELTMARKVGNSSNAARVVLGSVLRELEDPDHPEESPVDAIRRIKYALANHLNANVAVGPGDGASGES